LINDESLTPPKTDLPRFLMVENAANVGKKWVYTEGSSFILSANPNASKATGNGAKRKGNSKTHLACGANIAHSIIND
jgi:hypothetical protein